MIQVGDPTKPEMYGKGLAYCNDFNKIPMGRHWSTAGFSS